MWRGRHTAAARYAPSIRHSRWRCSALTLIAADTLNSVQCRAAPRAEPPLHIHEARRADGRTGRQTDRFTGRRRRGDVLSADAPKAEVAAAAAASRRAGGGWVACLQGAARGTPHRIRSVQQDSGSSSSEAMTNRETARGDEEEQRGAWPRQAGRLWRDAHLLLHTSSSSTT